MFTYEIKKEIASELIDYIESGYVEDSYLCDIASELYNNDYYMIGIYQCKNWLKEHFDDMLETIKYWEEETGSTWGHLITDVEKLVTLVAYTVADVLLNEIYNNLDLDVDDVCDKDYQYLILNALKEY